MKDITQLSPEEKVYELGRNNFRLGMNCAECAFKACIDGGLLGDFPPEVIALASGFGGGLGGKRQLCGAVTGGAMGLGLVKGRKNPLAKENMKERVDELFEDGGVYDTFYRYADEIEKHFGALTCRELVGKWLENGEMDTRERKKFCQELVGFCAKTAYKYAAGTAVEGTTVESAD